MDIPETLTADFTDCEVTIHAFQRSRSILCLNVFKPQVKEQGLIRFTYVGYISVPHNFSSVAIEAIPVADVPISFWSRNGWNDVEEEDVAFQFFDKEGPVHVVVAQAIEYEVVRKGAGNLQDAEEGYSITGHYGGLGRFDLEIVIERIAECFRLRMRRLQWNELGVWAESHHGDSTLSQSEWHYFAGRFKEINLWTLPSKIGSAFLDGLHFTIVARDGREKTITHWGGEDRGLWKLCQDVESLARQRLPNV